MAKRKEKKEKKTKNCIDCSAWTLKEIPHDINKIIILYQAELKLKRVKQRATYPKTIYQIIREWKEYRTNGGFIELNNFNVHLSPKITEHEKVYLNNEINKRMIK